VNECLVLQFVIIFSSPGGSYIDKLNHFHESPWKLKISQIYNCYKNIDKKKQTKK
jgi:hypothetical protein